MYVTLGAITTTLALNLLFGEDGNKNIVLENPGETNMVEFHFVSANENGLSEDIGYLTGFIAGSNSGLYVSEELSPRGKQKCLKTMTYSEEKEAVDSGVLSKDHFYFKLIQKDNNMCMFESVAYPGEVIDVEASREEPGARLIIYPRHDGDNQIFKTEKFEEFDY